MRRLVTIIAGLLALVVLGVSVFAFVTVRRSFPDTTGEVTIPGLAGDVTVARDGHGIPQIYADTPEDLFLAQGYVHAQDRFFEMDFRRHVTAGRLAELVGDAALDTDMYVRTLGWRRVAQQELALLDDDTLRLVNAYARGVNRYIDGRSASQLSLEYAVLDLTGPSYTPERWTAVDSLAWIKAMAWDLRSNMNDEIDRVLSTAKLSVDQVEQLYPAYPQRHATIVDGGTVVDGTFRADAPGRSSSAAPGRSAASSGGLARAAVASLSSAKDGAEALPTLLGTGDGVGSNSWAVSGDLTASGKPLLANDPHLAPSMPGIWYQVGLHCRTVDESCPYDVSGFSFSGLPGVVVGHNASIAWGVTTMYADVADLYLEKVTGDAYEYDGQQLPLETRQETFDVAGGSSRTITVRSTRHGPILSDLDDDVADVGQGGQSTTERGSYEVALRWTALDPKPTIRAVFSLARAQDWTQFRAAAKQFTVPSQNLVYADVKGNIGYQAPGTIPIRGRGDGRWPVPGWDPSYEWTGSVPFDQLPTVYNPSEGFVVTANNKVVGDPYPVLLGADTAAGYRSQRIRDLLDKPGSTDGFTVDDMSRMQNDTYNANAARLVPELLTIPLDTEYYAQGQRTLERWDLRQDADSPGAAYFNAVWRNLLARTFHDELPRDQWPDGGERWFSVVDGLMDDPASPWWDDLTTPGIRETRDQVLGDAMRDARDELTRIQSRDPDEWRWGTMHRLRLVNPTLGESGVGLVERLFNRGPYRLGGGNGIVDATSWDAREGYDVTAVPSMRMVVDLDDLDRSRWIQLTGSSGHAFHDHYVDQQQLWSQGRTLPWAFSRRAVDASTDDTLTLRPSGR